jgi:hypothetical protein
MKTLKELKFTLDLIKTFLPHVKIFLWCAGFFMVALIVISTAFIIKIQLSEKHNKQQEMIIEQYGLMIDQLYIEKTDQRVDFKMKMDSVMKEYNSLKLLYCPIDFDKELRLSGSFEPNQAGTLIK